MKENLRRTGSCTSSKKFWMYPRFLQMIMNVQHPNLPKADNDLLKIDAMHEQSLLIFKGFFTKIYVESDPPRKMFGALDNTEYVAPTNDKWRHDDSQSDDEEPKLNKMMEDKLGNKSDSSDSDDEDDEGGDGEDADATTASAPGATDASVAATTGASSDGGNAEDSESDDNRPELGYEFYLEDRGVRKVRKNRQEEDADYVLSDTEAERLKRKQTVARRKKKNRKYIGDSFVQPTVSQPEHVHEADMNPNLGLTADEAAAIISSPPRSSEPTPVVTSAVKTPTVTPQEPTRSIASTIRATTSQPSSERIQWKFSEMQQDGKVDFLFTQLQAVAGQIDRQSAVINVTRGDVIKQRLEMNTLKSTIERQQAEITRQQVEIEQLKTENACLKAADEERGTLKKRDHDSEDSGNLDPSATSEQPPATASAQIVAFEPPQIGSTQGTSGGTLEEIQQLETSSYVEGSLAGTSSILSSADIALQVVHPVTGEVLEEGVIVADLSNEQLLALNEMKAIDDAAIENIPSEPETSDLENIEEIVFEGDNNKSTYVQDDGTGFTPFNQDWLKENVDDIDEHLKNRDTTDNSPDAFT
ncbi:hypothetical protein Hanom_Chr03g00234171 [Helianthus anomalus]